MKKRICCLLVIFLVVLLSGCVNSNQATYQEALSLMGQSRYEDALALFRELQDQGYLDSAEKMEDCQNGISYHVAIGYLEAGNLELAKKQFESIGTEFQDTKPYLDAIDLITPYIGTYTYNNRTIQEMHLGGKSYYATYGGSLYAPLILEIKKGFRLTKLETGTYAWRINFPVSIAGEIHHSSGTTTIRDELHGGISFTDREDSAGQYACIDNAQRLMHTVLLKSESKLILIESQFNQDWSALLKEKSGEYPFMRAS